MTRQWPLPGDKGRPLAKKGKGPTVRPKGQPNRHGDSIRSQGSSMSTKTNFSKKKNKTSRRGFKDSYTSATNPRLYAQNPLKRHLSFPERTARKGRLRAIAGAPIRRAHPHERRSVHALEPNDLSNRGNAKNVASVGASRASRIRRLDARRQNDTRASIDSFRRSWRRWLRKRLTSMSTGARRASRSRSRSRVCIHGWI